jgi:hypothetical protein
LCLDDLPRLFHLREFGGEPFACTVAMKHKMQVRHALRSSLHRGKDFIGVGIAQAATENVGDGTFRIFPEGEGCL